MEVTHYTYSVHVHSQRVLFLLYTCVLLLCADKNDECKPEIIEYRRLEVCLRAVVNEVLRSNRNKDVLPAGGKCDYWWACHRCL